MLGDLRNRQPVEVAQGQRGAVVCTQGVEHLMGYHGVDLDVPRIPSFLYPSRWASEIASTGARTLASLSK